MLYRQGHKFDKLLNCFNKKIEFIKKIEIKIKFDKKTSITY